MKINFKNRFSYYLNIFIMIGIIFSMQIWIGYIVIKSASINDSDRSLKTLTERIQSDIAFENGKWDISKYASDPLTPNPHGSSGFIYPLYIITKDGFVIERNLPIGGLLDSSDFKHLKLYTSPQYVDGITNEKWRVHSKVLSNGSGEVGIIFLAHYNPTQSDTEVIDKDLDDTLKNIEPRIKYTEQGLDVSGVDIRNIPYDISMEIVTTYNKVIINNGRTPAFIDPSYVHSEFNNGLRFINDVNTNEPYLARTTVLKEDNGAPLGIIVMGSSLKLLEQILKKFLWFSAGLDFLLLVPIFAFVIKYVKPRSGAFVPTIKNGNTDIEPQKIIFDKNSSSVLVDNQSFGLPYASNQFALCETLFSKPNKRWEQDEILEALGEEIALKNNRKIYDAAIAINKRLSFKLIFYSGKTYQINPEYLPAIIGKGDSPSSHK